MDIKKVVPTNWFNREESRDRNLPAEQQDLPPLYSPFARFHRDVDRLFDDMFRDFSLPSLRLRPGNLFGNANALLQPNMDIASTDKEYTVTVEIPGVDENDIKLELSQDGILTVRGEKKQEKEHKDKDFHRIERSYGSFQRTLSLPEDADGENVDASFKNGLLTITVPRKEVADTSVKRIDIKKAG